MTQLLSTIFIDGGDPAETKKADELFKAAGYPGIGGQTTNPSLIAKNLSAKFGGRKVSRDEAFSEYRRIVTEMATYTNGPISIQVIGSAEATADELLAQARDRKNWIPNAVIKFPCIPAGLEAASKFCEEGPVNMTLVFSQEQAAAVYAATKNHKFDVYVSPFVGRLDDKGQNGMDVIANIEKMFLSGDRHVKVLTASTRTMDHILQAEWLKSEVITIPFKLISEWAENGFLQPVEQYAYPVGSLTPIAYKELPLDKPWTEYDIHHDLTDAGLKKFLEDWGSVVG